MMGISKYKITRIIREALKRDKISKAIEAYIYKSVKEKTKYDSD